MRVFYAIEFSDEIKKSIKTVQQSVQKLCLKGNFSHEENFHLTLRFIGEVDRREVEELKTCLDKAAETVEPFTLNFERIGWFSRGEKKMLWIGVKNQDNSLDKLYKSLSWTLEEKGYDSDKKAYKPHVTLSRETIFKEDYNEELSKIKIYSRDISVNKISLMESSRVKGRLTYTPIYIKKLGK